MFQTAMITDISQEPGPLVAAWTLLASVSIIILISLCAYFHKNNGHVFVCCLTDVMLVLLCVSTLKTFYNVKQSCVTERK